MTDDDDPEDELRRDDEGSHDPDEFDSGGVDFTSVFVLRARGPFQDWARQIVEEGPEWTLPDIDRCRAYLAAGAADAVGCGPMAVAELRRDVRARARRLCRGRGAVAA